jgi:replicative DNA helicase
MNNPLSDIDLEISILGTMLHSAKELELGLSYLRESDFTSKKHQVIFNTMQELFTKNTKVDAMTLINQLTVNNKLEELGGIEYISEIIPIYATNLHFFDHLKILQEIASKRKLGLLLQSAQQEIKNSNNVAELINNLENNLMNVLTMNRMDNTFVSVFDHVEEVYEKIKKMYYEKTEFTGLTSGIEEFDNLTGG